MISDNLLRYKKLVLPALDMAKAEFMGREEDC